MIQIDPFQFSAAAFLFGLLGSIHCIGMCGPIALALPPESNPLIEIIGRLLYNLGRTFSYVMLGLLAGTIGAGANLMGIQNWLSTSSGVLLILLALLAGGKLNVPGTGRISQWLRPYLSALFRKRHLGALAGIGLLNGLLPCGFVYSALAGAMNGGSPANAALFMSFFGLGTLPAMFTTALFGNLMSAAFRERFIKLAPVITVLLGLLLVLRGLELDIPYISPGGTHSSHH